jgi:hypothetical protein
MLFFVSTAATSSQDRPAPKDFAPDHLALACHVGGTRIALKFSDGFLATIDLARLGIPTSGLRLETARASWGSAVEIRRAGGGAMHVDSAVLRASLDPKFAEQLKREIAALGGG